MVSAGTPAELKARLGRRTATITLDQAWSTSRALGAVTEAGITATSTGCTIVAPIDAAGEIAGIVRALDAAGIPFSDLAVAEPSLDDVFLALESERVRRPAEVSSSRAEVAS